MYADLEESLGTFQVGILFSEDKPHCVKSVRIRRFSGLYFPTVGLNIQSECEKTRTRKTPNTDTFYAVPVYMRNIARK